MKKNDVDSKIIGLAGNPNVGKSTIFNTLTGLKQHTGNWPGKTVENASGRFSFQEQDYILYDLPGTYSLIAHSKEEECARDFICFEPHDAILVVCDAVCLERNLNLVLQTIEITPNVVVVVNLIDEAEKKKIHIDIPTLQKELQVPVVATSARSGKGIKEMLTTLAKTVSQTTTKKQQPIVYPPAIQHVQEMLLPFLNDFITVPLPSSYVALKLLLEEQSFMEELQKHQDCSFLEDPLFTEQLRKAHAYLETHGITKDKRMEYVVQAIVQRTEEIAKHCISFRDQDYQKRDRKIDRILTNKWTGIPIMLLLLMGVGIMESRRSGLEHTVRNGEELERVDEFHENKQAMAFLEELERSKDTPQSIQCIDFSCFLFLSLSLTRSRRHRERRLHALRGRVHRQSALETARASLAREQSGPQSDHLSHQSTPFRIAQRLQSLYLPRPPRSRPQQYSLSLY